MNENLIAEYRDLCRQIKRLQREDKLAERNALIPRIWELNKQIDWGYKPGELVERRSSKMWVEDTILSIHENEFVFRSVTVPHQMVRKKTEQYEQMTLL